MYSSHQQDPTVRRNYAVSRSRYSDCGRNRGRQNNSSRKRSLDRSPSSVPSYMPGDRCEIRRKNVARSDDESQEQTKRQFSHSRAERAQKLLRTTAERTSTSKSHKFIRNRRLSAIKKHNERPARSYDGNTQTESHYSDTSAGKFPDSSAYNTPDTATVMKRALLQRSEIESRKNMFATLTNSQLFEDQRNPKYFEKVPDTVSASSSENVTFTYNRPSLRHKKSKFRVRRERDESSSQERPESTKISFTLKRPSLIFKHPEATYILTKIPKRKSTKEFEESVSSTSSSESLFSSCLRGRKRRHDSTPSEEIKDFPLSDSLGKSKRSVGSSSSRFPAVSKWDPDIEAIYAAVSRITPPTRGRPKRSTHKRPRPWSPQREPRDRGLSSLEYRRIPPEKLHGSSIERASVERTSIERASGFIGEDRGTSPLPLPQLEDRAVGSTIETRGTSPLIQFSTVDQGINIEESAETWKDPKIKNLEEAIKIINHMPTVYPHHMPSIFTTQTRMNPPDLTKMSIRRPYSLSPPQRPPVDKGIVASVRPRKIFPPPAEDAKELEREWSGHSIIFDEFGEEKKRKRKEQLWPSPNPFKVLNAAYTLKKPSLDEALKEIVNSIDIKESLSFSLSDRDDSTPSSSPQRITNIIGGALDSCNPAPRNIDIYPLSLVTGGKHFLTKSDSRAKVKNEPKKGTISSTDVAKCANTNEPQAWMKNIKEPLFKKMHLRSTWALPPEKVAIDSPDELPRWSPSMDVLQKKSPVRGQRRVRLTINRIGLPKFFCKYAECY